MPRVEVDRSLVLAVGGLPEDAIVERCHRYDRALLLLGGLDGDDHFALLVLDEDVGRVLLSGLGAREAVLRQDLVRPVV